MALKKSELYSSLWKSCDELRGGMDASQIKAAIFAHPEFTAFNQQVTQRFAEWRQANTPHLSGIAIGDRPKVLIETLSENLLETFRIVPLIDPYDVYQHLMDYWAETMQDDAWQIVLDGWQAQQQGKPNSDLIPAALIIARYFATEQRAIEALESERDAISRQLEEQDEEQGGEEGLLNDAKTDKGKLTAKSVKDRLKAISSRRVDKRSASTTDEAAEERKALQAYADLIEQEASASKKVKEAQKALDAKVTAQYAHLSEAEIKTLVVEDKWLAALAASVQSELDRVSQALTGRIKQLAERYATPLPQLTIEVAELSAKVETHLKRMGFQS